MENRRTFMKKMGRGLAASSIAFPGTMALGSSFSTDLRPIRIGIIGAENSHTIGYGKLFNMDKKFPGREPTETHPLHFNRAYLRLLFLKELPMAGKWWMK